MLGRARGGLAVSVRSEPRFTRDIDLAVAVAGDSQAEGLVRRLIIGGYRVEAMIEQQATGRFATARLVPPQHGRIGVIVDLLFASSGIEREIVEMATIAEIWPKIHGAVARTGHLIALKILSRDPQTRPKDEMDLVALARVADDTERRLGLEAASLIEARGFARGRTLVADARELLATIPFESS